MNSFPIGWGIIGCGSVVVKKSGPSILQVENHRIVGVMRREPAKARPFAQAHSIGLCTGNATEILHHPEVDIVYIATPPSSHKEYVLAAAAAGKHILVEKPMGLSAEDDREMIDACRRAGVELFVSYYRRFHPHVLKMRELIREGIIGKPILAQVDFAQPVLEGHDWGWRINPENSGGGLFVDVVSHRIDLLNDFLGEPVITHGRISCPASGQEIASLVVAYSSGAAAGILGDFTSNRKQDYFAIHGTSGSLIAKNLDGHAFELRSPSGSQAFTYEPTSAPHLGLVQHIGLVLSGKIPNATSGWHALQTDRILDDGYRAHWNTQ
jgi:predicted dehydrogenase